MLFLQFKDMDSVPREVTDKLIKYILNACVYTQHCAVGRQRHFDAR